MNTKVLICLGAAASCACAFFIGRITAMDSVAEAEADITRREIEHDLAVDRFGVLLDDMRRINSESMDKTAAVIASLEAQQEKETQETIAEGQRLLGILEQMRLGQPAPAQSE